MTYNTEAKDMGVERVTVFSKPSCVQCNATYRALESRGLSKDDYDVVDISLPENEYILTEFKARAKMQAPIVAVPNQDIWTGFRPDMIAQHV